MADDFRGVGAQSEISTKKIWRDVRTTREKLIDFLSTPDGFLWVNGSLIAFMVIKPFFWEWCTTLILFYFWWARKIKFKLPFRMPMASGLLDPNDPSAGGDEPGKANGITYFGNERGSKKELWFKNDDMRTHVLIFGSTGAGKALKNTELIHTPNGWVKNNELVVGDLVTTPFGTSPVVGIYPQGKLQLFKIVFGDKREIEVSGDHLWEVHHKNWKKTSIDDGVEARAKVITTKELMLEMCKNKVNQNYYVILSNEVEKPAQELTLDPYLLGALLGDGTITSRNIRFSSQDSEIINKIKNLLPNDLIIEQLKSDKKYDYHIQFNPECRRMGRNTDASYFERTLSKELKKYNLFGTNSFSKFIPQEYKNGSIEQRYKLVQGLMDTDGGAHKGRTEFSTTSEQLANDLADVIRSLGGIVNISERHTAYTYKNVKKIGAKSYRLYIKHPEPHKLFSLTRKKEQVSTYQYKDTLKLSIKSISELDKKEDCQCIKIADKRGLFITKDYIVTHNTETLLSLAFNALVQGSGLIYVDGKGENVLFTKIFAMARTMGREDDLLIINYMTGSRDVFGPQTSKLSNTLNPFTSGSSGGLTELLVSLMDDSGGDGGMWKGRAISLISAIMMALVYMRDKKEILLDVDIIREYLILDNIVRLYKTRKDLPNHIRQSMRAYLVSLPGFQENAPKQGETTLEQHGYLQMQFTKILGSLSDSYGYIFRTNLGEVDFWDVVVNRRILVVLLPALEKSSEELANLGKIIVACLKQMMATGLGSMLEGDYSQVVETKPTNSPCPFMCVLDEYGYYAVKGAAVMPAQARSLGFSMIFAGQDLPAFEKASKEEAASTVANCNIKIFMKLEDPQSTFELFEKSVGEAYVSQSTSYELKNGGLMSGYAAGQGANVTREKRGNLLDLKDQREGEAHIIFKSAVIRAKMFYASPPKPPKIQLNYFVKVEPPDEKDIRAMDEAQNTLQKKITNILHIKEVEDATSEDDDNITKSLYVFDTQDHLSPLQTGMAAFAFIATHLQDVLSENANSLKQIHENDDDDEKVNIFSRYQDDDEDEDNDDEEDDDEINVFLEEDDVKSNLAEIERLGGTSDIEARQNAEKIVEDLKEASEYPKTGVPEDKEPEEIMDMLKELDESFDLEDDE